MRALNGRLIWSCIATLTVVAACARAPAAPHPAPQGLIGVAAPTEAPAPDTATPTPTATPTITPTPTVTPTPTDGPPLGELGARLDAYVARQVEALRFRGAVLVARQGEVLLSKGYGRASEQNDAPNTAKTRFRLASVTKQFTAASIMLLEARGKLRLEDAVCTYLQPCPESWQGITIYNLLTHTSGLPNYTDFGGYERTQMQPATPEQLLARFSGMGLAFLPGRAYAYGNSGYVVLGLVIERVSGQSYADFLRDNFLAPLEMHDTGVDLNDGFGIGEAIGYQEIGREAPPLDPTTLYAAGGLYSTVEDLYRWDQALYTDEPLPAAQREEMFSAFRNNYGCGWKVAQVAGRRKIWHPGLMDGFATYFARYPDDRVTVIVLSNLALADVEGISNELARIVFRG